MIKARSFQSYATGCAFAVVCLCATTSHAAVTAEPAMVTFMSPEESFTIKLANDGVPIAATDVKGWQFFASGHDYKHMLSVEKINGALKISPSSTVEVGSYDLNIETAHGAVVVRVLTPLSAMPDIVDKMTVLSGLSEQKIAERLGLTSDSGRSDIQIDLPPVYYEGQTLEMTMPSNPGDGHTCMWFINGDSVAEGSDQCALSYTFLETGDYVLTYIETKTVDGAQVIAAHTKSFTRVVRVPAVANDIAVDRPVTYSAPMGYQKHAWSVDGKTMSEEPEFTHKFSSSGAHIVECLASNPEQGPAKGFLRIRYNTTVSPS